MLLEETLNDHHLMTNNGLMLSQKDKIPKKETHEKRQMILFMDSGSIIGGGQNNLLLIASHIDLQRFIPIVFCRRNSHLYNFLKQGGICTKGFYMIAKSSNMFINQIIMILNTLFLIPQLIRVIYNEKIGLIDSHCNDTHLPAIIAAKFFGIPVVVHDNIYIKKIRHRIIDFLCGSLSDKIISCSQASKNKLILSSSALKKVVVVYPSIHPNIFNSMQWKQRSLKANYAIHKNQLIIGTLARISPEKGLEYLINAYHMVRKAYPNTKLIIAGDVSSDADREYEMKIINLIKTLNLKNDVIIHKATLSNVLQGEYHFQDFDISVSSSLYEAFGMFILESMALEKPVVATKVGGISEVAVDDQTAILVKPSDSKALAEAISVLIADEKKRLEMGEKGKRRALKYFSLQNTIFQIEDIYNGFGN